MARVAVWVKVFDFASPHPIMNVRLSSLRRDAPAAPRSLLIHSLCRQEDHWDTGDMHFQFWPCDGSDGTYCSGQQGMLIHAVNGNTMQPNQWGHSQVECKMMILSRFVCFPAR